MLPWDNQTLTGLYQSHHYSDSPYAVSCLDPYDVAVYFPDVFADAFEEVSPPPIPRFSIDQVGDHGIAMIGSHIESESLIHSLPIRSIVSHGSGFDQPAYSPQDLARPGEAHFEQQGQPPWSDGYAVWNPVVMAEVREMSSIQYANSMTTAPNSLDLFDTHCDSYQGSWSDSDATLLQAGDVHASTHPSNIAIATLKRNHPRPTAMQAPELVIPDLGQIWNATVLEDAPIPSRRSFAHAANALPTFPRRPTHPIYYQPLVTPVLATGFNTSIMEPRGRLDQYIMVFGQMIKRMHANGQLTRELRHKLSLEGVLWVVREAWPRAEHYWKVTASFLGFLQSEMWRNFPEEAVYKAMHPAYRPTSAQLSISHSPVIDWLPWPDLRDKIIAYQDQTDVDLVCKIAIQNVVAHRRTPQPLRHKSPTNKGSKKAKAPSGSMSGISFRVWDLCLLEEKAGSGPPLRCGDPTYKPRSASVRALENAFGLECDDFGTHKLHPDFFKVFPYLFAESAVSKCPVQDLPNVSQIYDAEEDILGSPQLISQESVDRLEAVVGSYTLRP